MSERPWYRRYGSDFIAGTLGLSLEEKGAYSIVLDLIYDRRRPIPDDARYIAGVCGCSVRKWTAIKASLLGFGAIVITEGNGVWASIIDKWEGWSPRKPIQAALRQAVIDRDGFVCAYCGDETGEIHLDHIHPVSLGGRNTVDNLTVSCPSCNLSKGSKTLAEWLQ